MTRKERCPAFRFEDKGGRIYREKRRCNRRVHTDEPHRDWYGTEWIVRNDGTEVVTHRRLPL